VAENVLQQETLGSIKSLTAGNFWWQEMIVAGNVSRH